MKKYITLFTILLMLPLFGQTKVGSTAAPFLSIGIGSRSLAMGGAFVATANDVSALYWNPAGIARMEQGGAQFTHSKWFADITFNWAGGMIQLGDMGIIGLSLTYLDYGKIEVTTMQDPTGTGEEYSANDLSMALTYAYRLTDRFSIGANFKYINQSIWNSSASAFAMDVGVLFRSDINGLRIGATIMNFGSDMKMDGKDLLVLHDIDEEIFGNNDQILATLKTDEFPLPLTFKVGVAMEVLELAEHRITIGVDALHPNDNAESLNVGGEYVFHNLFAIRGGYKSLFLDNSEEGLTLGFGVQWNFAPDFGVQIDYCYQDFGILEDTQHFSVGVKF